MNPFRFHARPVQERYKTHTALALLNVEPYNSVLLLLVHGCVNMNVHVGMCKHAVFVFIHEGNVSQ